MAKKQASPSSKKSGSRKGAGYYFGKLKKIRLGLNMPSLGAANITSASSVPNPSMGEMEAFYHQAGLSFT